MEWLQTNWPWILLGLTLVSSVLNAITKHYGTASPKLKQALMLVIDILSIVTSKGSPGTVKLPGTTSQPPKKYLAEVKKCRNSSP